MFVSNPVRDKVTCDTYSQLHLHGVMTNVCKQENATTVVRKKVRVLCVMAFEQPVTNRVPPALTLVKGVAITPMHHVYVDGMWLQAREVAARAVRATGAPVLEVLVGDLTARYQFPLGHSTRWVYNLVLY